MIKGNIFKYILICWIFLGTLCVCEVPSFAAGNNEALNKQLQQTNSKRDYFRQKKNQTDLKLKKERNKLNNNQQKLEKAQVQLRTSTQRYNSLMANLNSMERQLNAALIEFKNIDLNEVVAGIQIQLLTYLDAVSKKENADLAGVLYFNLIEPVIKAKNKNLTGTTASNTTLDYGTFDVVAKEEAVASILAEVKKVM